ncbi:MAG: YdeI/OmpD-associated family protein [Opitutaceae bacterium]|nr:YdeI/OmpD-associated family protein [Opitutaceae bacterium]
MAKNLDPRIDACIDNSAAFAQPILKHLRKLVHRACPQVEETMKWSMPHFVIDGKILCSMAAFKEHCAFGFWHQQMQKELGEDGARADAAMGSLGRITSRSDLPEDFAMIRHIKRAAELNATAPARPRKKTGARRELPVPRELAAALAKNKSASATFKSFSPSHRDEYIEWITEAKRDETRQKRLATTVEWLNEGKSRNWKYEQRSGRR